MKNKFKVGDRVESIACSNKGVQGTIKEVKTRLCLPYSILFDNGDIDLKEEKNLKLIPNMKHIKDLGEKVAIQCKTQEEWDWVSKELGYEWLHSEWSFNKEKSIICTDDKACGSIDRTSRTIVQASDFMPSTVNQRIEQLEKELADLKESVRPKKKIEFVKYLSIVDMELKPKASDPKDYDNVELLQNNGKYDIIKAWNNISDPFIFLGHFNEGEK